MFTHFTVFFYQLGGSIKTAGSKVGLRKRSKIISYVDICNVYVFVLFLHISPIGISNTVIDEIIMKISKK